ncbi:FecR family protein [Pedobacter nanyangensis]|uniref:FecR family protein n=1 Tax=Pedobacter nanyangensis TaxID=1562389 RepID=UPI000DE4740A|nr:FecR domain-containing protein [Pedobacter nanyangensis]
MIAEHEYIRQLFLEKLAGTISPADDRILQQLITKNEVNKAFWNSLNEQRKQLNAEQFVADLDEAAALKALKQQLPTRKLPVWKYVAAAAIFMAVGAAVWINLPHDKNNSLETATQKTPPLDHKAIQLQLDNGEILTLNKQDKNGLIDVHDVKIRTSEKGIEAINGGNADAQTTLYVPAKQDYHITLSDGTKVWLNSASKLQFPIRFTGPLREIYMEGEAYLEVAKNANKPFIVHTRTTAIKVLGTKFNLNTYDENLTKTSLVEGAVLLTSDQKSVKLMPGQQGNFSTGKGFSVTAFDQDQTLGWINGTYYFQNNSLKEIAKVINRWFDVEVVFENPQLANFRLSGMLEKQQLAAFLKDLESASDIETKLANNKLYIK